MIRRLLIAPTLFLMLVSCGTQPVVVGSKDSVQDEIIAEMIVSLLQGAGIPVSRRMRIGESTTVFEAMRAGAIHLYPEYTGTALSYIGAPPSPDPSSTLEQVRAAFAERGLVVLDPLGFESTYAAVARPDFLERHGIETIEDLSAIAGDLRIGASAEFAARPTDGLRPFLDRFGLRDAARFLVPEAEREDLYARLIRDELDLVIGYSTDPEIVDFDLRVVPAKTPFFPAYEAVPITTDAVLEVHPGIAEALEPLAGMLDDAEISRLVRQVTIGGRSPRAVANTALGEMGLRARVTQETLPLLAIAVEPAEIGGRLANTVLRVVRTAMPGRRVTLVPDNVPAALLADRKARLALMPSLGYFELNPDDGVLVRHPDIEAVAIVGTADVYAFALPEGPDSLAAAVRIAAGPAGSPSHTLAELVARSGETDAEVVVLEATGAQAVGEALDNGEADAGLVVASRERRDVELLLREGRARLIDAASWWRGSARLDAPFLRELLIPAAARPFLSEDVATLAMQYTLAGPAPERESRLGQSGPVSYSAGAQPLASSKVRAINDALGPAYEQVSPHLRRAAALEPVIEPPPSALNPAPMQALLAIGIMAYLVLMIWLYVRSGRQR